MFKINIQILASQVGVLSEDEKMYMKLLTPKRYYDLNDRTINLLMKGDIDMGATTSESAEAIKDSDAEVLYLMGVEKEFEFVVGKNKTRAGGSFFPCINNTTFDLTKHVIVKRS